MRRIVKNISSKLPICILYLEDVEAIIDVLERANAKEITINTKTHELKSTELNKIKADKTNYLEIVCREPYISIEFSESNAWMFATQDDFVSRGIVSSIESLVRKRKRPIANILGTKSFSLFHGSLTGLVMSSAIFIKYFSKKIQVFAAIFYIIGLVTLVLLWKLSNKFSFQIYSTIFFKNKKDINFFRRNKDQIILSIISTIIGSVFGAVAMLIVTMLTK